MNATEEKAIATAKSYNAGNIGGLDDAWTRRLVASTVATESYGGNLDADNKFGYYGRYQGGAGWLADAGLVNMDKYQAAFKASGYDSEWDWGVAGKQGKSGGPQAFLENPANWNNGHSLNKYLQSAELQDGAFKTNSDSSYQRALRDGSLNQSSDPAEVAGFLKARHIAGYGGATAALQGRSTGADANGTDNLKYFNDIAQNRDGFNQHFVGNHVVKPGTPSQGGGNVTAAPMADGMLKQGEKGPEVKALQEQLIKSGITTINGQPFIADSDYGPATKAAVMQYQRAHNLQDDGIAGKDTLAALKAGTPAQTTPQTPGTPAAPQTPPAPTPNNASGAELGAQIAANARTWAGRDFKPGESERCQDFVNTVLNTTSPGLANKIGTTQNAVDGLGSGELLASRFFGDDKSQTFKDPSQARPGDIIAFTNTYGDYPKGTITHVGIYVGDGMMVDRSTSSKPVNLRSIDTFGEGNYTFARPNAYDQTQSITSPVSPGNAGGQTGAMSDGMLKQGEKGPEVKALQEQLIKSGITTVNGQPFVADSDYGPLTKAAVTQYQRTHNLQDDGVAGKDTLAALKAGTPTQTAPTTPAPTTPAPTGTTPPAPTAPAPTGTTPTPTVPAPAKVEPTTAGISAALAASEGILMQGSKGAEVTKLQEQLSKLGYTDAKGQPIKADGEFGQGTKEALMAFEKSRGMEQNGIAGPKTLEALSKAEQAPQLSNANHPDNAMYKQADALLAKLPNGTFKTEQERNNAAGAVTYEAKVSGMTQIDTIVTNTSGNGFIASQGNPQTTGERIVVQKDAAVTQPVEKSTQMIAQDAPAQAAKTVEAPVKTTEQPEQPKKPSILVA